MKKSEIEIGGKYVARVSGVFVTVRVDEIIEPVLRSKHVYAKGMGRRIDRTAYHVTNLRTGRPLTFKSAAKFRSVARPDGAEAPDSKIVRTTIAYNRELSEYKVKGYNAPACTCQCPDGPDQHLENCESYLRYWEVDQLKRISLLRSQLVGFRGCMPLVDELIRHVVSFTRSVAENPCGISDPNQAIRDYAKRVNERRAPDESEDCDD